MTARWGGERHTFLIIIRYCGNGGLSASATLSILATISPRNASAAASSPAAARASGRDAGLLQLDELMSWVRHNKGKLVAEALAALPDARFDPSVVKYAYVADFGTQYVDALYGPAFHVNKADDKGNTLLTVSAQNGRLKIAQLLVRGGR